ncbi:MAG: septum formation protein Maf [Bacteroidetes bacterium]|jgi:septum formation protein|nr:septum formation protein Maf [Bacteroidota bacterium]
MPRLLSDTPFILASQSPRRRRLLERLGLTFEVIVSPAEEVVHEPLAPGDLVQRLATKKATPIAQDHPDALTLAADTIVVHDGDILEKPSDDAHARAMLERLSDATHTVFTGIALHHPATDRRATAVEATQVTFAPLSAAEIDAYVASGSPLDKAGGYGIQDDFGALFVAHIDGDYYNVVGLPLHRLYQTLRHSFADLMAPSLLSHTDASRSHA